LRGQVSYGHLTGLSEAQRQLLPPFPVNGHGSFISGVPTPEGLSGWFIGATFERNCEQAPVREEDHAANQVRLDMESATIAANGFRFRVPYGTLLCVSDKPLHGEIKLPGMANHFYRERVNQHLQIGIRAVTLLRDAGPEQLHSRKLRSFAEVAFQ
jgi:AMP nucleosidase